MDNWSMAGVLGNMMGKKIQKLNMSLVKFMFSKKATKNYKIFTVDLTHTKGGFFSESAICFSNLQISKKKNIQKKLS